MKPFRNFCAGVIALSAVMSFPASSKADIQTIRDSDNAVWGAVGGEFLNYKEDISPIPDSEHGWISSLATGWSYLGYNDIYFAAESSLAAGDAHYNGAFLYHPTVPVQGTTAETITTIDAKAGKGFAVNPNTMLIPYVELGFRFWNRDLGGGQTEDYNHFDALGGLMAQYSPLDRLVLTAYGSAGGTFAGQMSTGGDTFDLGSAAVYKAGGKVGYDLTQKFEIFATLDYEHFRYVNSDVVDGLIEPSSFTNQTALRAGVAYHLR